MWRNLFRRNPGITVEQVIHAAQILADHIANGEEAQIGALRYAGFDIGRAHRFAAFLPIAFSRPVLEDLGVAEFRPTVGVPTENGGCVDVRLNRQPEYVAALALARQHRRFPCLPPGVYETITGSSADIDAVSNALNAGADIEGAAIASALVGANQIRFVLR